MKTPTEVQLKRIAELGEQAINAVVDDLSEELHVYAFNAIIQMLKGAMRMVNAKTEIDPYKEDDNE